MSIDISSDLNGVAENAVIDSVALNNALGGAVSTTWDSSLRGAVGGGAIGVPTSAMNTNNYLAYSGIANAGIRALKVRFKRNSGTNSVIFGVRCTSRTLIDASGFFLRFNTGHTSMRLAKGGAGGALQVLADVAMTSVTDTEFDVFLDPVFTGMSGSNQLWTVTARLLKVSDGTTLLEHVFTGAITTGAPALGNWSGFGFYYSTSPNVASWDDVSWDNMQSGSAPVLTSPTGTKNGKNAATGTVSTNAATGVLYYALTDTPTPLGTDPALWSNSVAVTSTGVKNVAWSGLAAGSTKYAQYMHVPAGRIPSNVAVSSAFTTDAPLPSPAGTSATNVLGGKVVITFTSTGGTVDGATASLPAAATPNGAVAQGPVAMVYNATAWPGVWSAEFTPPAGDYGVPVVLASNADNSSVSITGAVAFYLEDPTGTSVPAVDSTAPTLTNPTLTSDAPGFIAAAATTNEATGTAYAVVTNSTTKPTPAQVKAAQGAGGAAAPWSHSVLVTAIGAISLRKAHTLGIGAWYAHITHEDGAVNQAAVVTSPVFNIADGTKPVMQGTVSLASLTPTSYTVGCDAATDNVGVTGYQVSLDGGANWIEKNTARTHNATGRTPATTDAVQWRAYDAAGNLADPISRSVTLASVPAPVITTQPASTSVVEGNATTLTAAATVSPGSLSWAWFSRPKNDTGSGTIVPNATAASLHIDSLELGQDGIQYRARARNTIGGVNADTFTNWATMTVNAAVQRPVMVGELTFSNVTATGYRVSWEPALNEPTNYSYTLSTPPVTPWESVGLALYVDIAGRPPGIADLVSVVANNSAGSAFVELNGYVELLDQPALPPGPGGKIVGITPAALFHRLAVAAND